MSAALSPINIMGQASPNTVWKTERPKREERSEPASVKLGQGTAASGGIAFYRRHTEKMLKRYLCASMLVGRAPSLLGDPVGRGWASSRPVRTFEDSVIFVLDMERCLDKLDWLDRQILGKVVLQDYTQTETAGLLGMSVRTMSFRLPEALDRLTQILLAADLLVLPD